MWQNERERERATREENNRDKVIEKERVKERMREVNSTVPVPA